MSCDDDTDGGYTYSANPAWLSLAYAYGLSAPEQNTTLAQERRDKKRETENDTTQQTI